jgi:predicted transcriptional regulator
MHTGFTCYDFGFKFAIHNTYNTNYEKLMAEKQMSHTISKAKSLIFGKETFEKPYRSKLVICIDILCTLVSRGPMKFTQLSHKVELDTIRFIPHLKLLIDRGLVEQQNLGENEIFYVVTERGLKVLKVISPIIREAHKLQMRDFEIISNTLSEAGYS